MLLGAFLVLGMEATALAGEKTPRIVNRWQERLEEAGTWLEQGEWARAERSMSQVVDDMALRIESGERARPALALAVAHRALALAGLGRTEDAIWSWQLAQSLDPELRGARFPSFGAAGRLLEGEVLRAAGQLPPGRIDRDRPEEQTPGWQAPAPRSVPPSRFFREWPAADPPLRVEVLVDSEGRIHSPVVIEGEDAGRLYRGLEALRGWRFRPARVGDEPVPSLLVLRDFELPLSFAFAMARHEALSPIHGLLLDERWQEAEEAARGWLDLALSRPRHPRKSIHDLGSALVLLSLAEAGGGKADAALWHWHLAASFRESPRGGRRANLHELTRFGLEAYGSPGRWLTAHPARCTTAGEACQAVDLARSPSPSVRPPRPRSRPMPSELDESREPDRVLIRLLVDAEGRPREPRVLAGHSEKAVYLALEALREWRFEPARRDGKPVASVIEMTFPFAPGVPAERIAGWRRQLDAAERALREGEVAAALETLLPVLDELATGLHEGGWDLMGRAVALRALAEAAAGRRERAVWDWYVAQNLDLALQHLELEPFGAAGERLAAHRLEDCWQQPEGSPQPELEPTRAPAPSYESHVPEIIDIARIRLLVDHEGQPIAPLVLQGRQPGPLYSTLETLAAWRFAVGEPASAPRIHHVAFPLSVTLSMDEVRDLDARLEEVYQLAPNRWSRIPILLAESRRRARSGNAYSALSLWRSAQLRVPALALLDLSDMGVAGRVLEDARWAPSDRWFWKRRPVEARPRLLLAEEASALAELEEGVPTAELSTLLPAALFTPSPKYTEEARKARIQGTVIAQVVIDREGYVTRVKILKGLPEGLSESAAATLRRWRFAPATQNGEPVAVYSNLTVSFRLQ